MTRVGDGYVSLANRAALANRARDCIFVSIHFQRREQARFQWSGNLLRGAPDCHRDTDCFLAPFLAACPLPESPNIESQNLAGLIQDSLIARTQAVNRGTKAEQFFVLANVRHPAVLVEGGFLTNKEDIARIGSVDYREQLAAAISEGILSYRDRLKQRQPTLAVTAPDGAE